MRKIEITKEVLETFNEIKKGMSHGYSPEGEIAAAILTYCVLSEPIEVDSEIGKKLGKE